jgi:hypothetical protein
LKELGSLGFGVEVLAGVRPLELDGDFDLGQLGAEPGLDLLSAVELAQAR